MTKKITGRVVNFENKSFVPAEISVTNGRISGILPVDSPDSSSLPYILPGFIDSHVHIESSMLVPSEFARLAVVHGTVATVSDPHEIANVCGLKGVDYMIEDGKKVPFKFYFGAPSCVPATKYESAGAELNAKEVDKLLQRDEIRYLSEMMNFPGVLQKEEEVMKKIRSAQRLQKPVDGHAPGLTGEEAREYIAAGISTDHECFTKEEALFKLSLGMKILIREGSAAKNFDALIDLLNEYPSSIMFCSDDKHPDSLLKGHINELCSRAVKKGLDIFKVLQAACVNPVRHYHLDTGLLQPGDPADFILVRDLENFEVLQTYINGRLVAEKGISKIERVHSKSINQFSIERKTAEDFRYHLNKWGDEENIEQVYAIEALDGQLITNKLICPVNDVVVIDDCIFSNPSKDLLKIVVINRYQDAPVAKSFIKNFGLKKGAIASSVAHDSHNIVAVGVDDESLLRAVNLVIDHKGGISFYAPPIPGKDPGADMIIPLPVAGLMSTQDGYKIAEEYTAIDKAVKEAGATLGSPFMTLSFMALLVIPHLKLSDMGLFDGDRFSFV